MNLIVYHSTGSGCRHLFIGKVGTSTTIARRSGCELESFCQCRKKPRVFGLLASDCSKEHALTYNHNLTLAQDVFHSDAPFTLQAL